MRKQTTIRATEAGERIFVDTARPYKKAINGICYWVEVVNNFTRMGFCYFVKNRDEIGKGFLTLISKFKVHGKRVRFIRCDNARENGKYIEEVADKEGILMECTTTETL